VLEVADHRFTADLLDRRRALAACARGRVLAIGEGPGLDPGEYASGEVSSVVTLEPAAASAKTDFPPASFDTILTNWIFCRVADPDNTAAAIFRWLKPDGSLFFLEHVLGVGFLARAQRALSPLWVRLAGCQLDRDTIGALRRAGLAVTDCERFAIPGRGPLLRTCVQGMARPRPLQAYRSPGDDGWSVP
jgi:SAM-dependent methyltransferase